MFQSSAAESATLNTIDIGTDICSISTKIRDGTHNVGIRLYDCDQNIFVDETWLNFGSWTPLQPIPENQIILGFKCTAESNYEFLIHLSFLLGNEEEVAIFSELSFPATETYPSMEEFGDLLKQGSFPKLSGINYKHEDDQSEASAFQLIFNNGADPSPLFATSGSSDETLV